jgi:hypothetical protein
VVGVGLDVELKGKSEPVTVRRVSVAREHFVLASLRSVRVFEVVGDALEVLGATVAAGLHQR